MDSPGIHQELHLYASISVITVSLVLSMLTRRKEPIEECETNRFKHSPPSLVVDFIGFDNLGNLQTT